MNIFLISILGIGLGYTIFQIGFRMGFVTALARMNAVIVQMQDVMEDLSDLSHQWTEDDL